VSEWVSALCVRILCFIPAVVFLSFLFFLYVSSVLIGWLVAQGRENLYRLHIAMKL